MDGYDVEIEEDGKVNILGKSGAPVEISKIILPNSIAVTLNNKEAINVTFEPKRAKGNVTYTIEDNKIAEIENGNTIKGKTFGKTKLKASVTLSNGEKIEAETEVNVYQQVTYIRTAEELRRFAEEVNNGKTFENELVKVENDINLGGKAEDETTWWTAIGTATSKFAGIFDGGHHAIKGIYVNVPDGTASLFTSVNGATLKNIGIENSTFIGKSSTSLVYSAPNSDIYNCYSKNSTITGTINASGLIVVGGEGCTLSNCYNESEIYLTENSSVQWASCAGIVCSIVNGGVCRNCYNKGNLTVQDVSMSRIIQTGGIAGAVYASGELRSSYNSGNIVFAGSDRSGLIVGECNTGGIVEKCYSLDSVSNIEGISLCNTVDGGGRLIDCSVLTDTYMKSQQFVDDLNNGNEEENKTWKLNSDGGYPVLEYKEN